MTRSPVWLAGVLAAFVTAVPLGAQGGATPPVPGTHANWALAARFAPYRIRRLVHSTSVNPRWIQGTERFWYSWETGDGEFYYLVDPVAGTQRQLFDRDRIAAELTRITLDPWDAQHLPIRRIRFVNPTTLEFEVAGWSRDC